MNNTKTVNKIEKLIPLEKGCELSVDKVYRLVDVEGYTEDKVYRLVDVGGYTEEGTNTYNMELIDSHRLLEDFSIKGVNYWGEGYSSRGDRVIEVESKEFQFFVEVVYEDTPTETFEWKFKDDVYHCEDDHEWLGVFIGYDLKGNVITQKTLDCVPDIWDKSFVLNKVDRDKSVVFDKMYNQIEDMDCSDIVDVLINNGITVEMLKKVK